MLTIDQLIARSCQRHPQRTALQYKNGGTWQSLRYEQLWQQVQECAAALQGLGVQKGEHIALLAPSSPQWVISYLAILHLGCIAVPIDKELKSTELRHILNDSSSHILFSASGQLDKLLPITDQLDALQKLILFDHLPPVDKVRQSGQILAQIDNFLHELHSLESLPAELQEQIPLLHQAVQDNLSQQLVETSPSALLQSEAVNQLRQQQRLLGINELAQGPENFCPGNHQAQDCAVILYTSGTTGHSKGAMLSHENIVSNITAALKHFRLTENIHTLSFLPINHVFEQVCGILLPLSLGGSVTFAESIKKLADNLSEIQPNFLLGVPAVYRLLYDRILKNINSSTLSRTLFNWPLTRKLVTRKVQERFGRDITFVSGGAALDPAVAAGFQQLGLRLLQGYGITETSPVISAESPDFLRPGTVGLPLAGVNVEIRDPNPDGAGEICVKGPNVMLGYFHNDKATAEVLQDGWYHTGDLGLINADGTLQICGRVKNLIVTQNGKNVYPEEVENYLLNSPYIAEIMVYGQKVSATGEEVCASIFPDEDALFEYQRQQGGEPLDNEQLETLIKEEVLKYGRELADYKRVKRFNLREEEFPKTTTRKIKRHIVDTEVSINN